MLAPYSEPISGDDHFAPVTGFDAFGAWVTGTYGVDFPISLGDHPIFAGSSISTQIDLTLTPFSASPAFSVNFAPCLF